jgi:maltose O-acetyltransferase
VGVEKPKVDNAWYQPSDPMLRERRHAAHAALYEFNGLPPNAVDRSRELLRNLLGELGEGARVRAPFYCDYGDPIRIGSHSFLNFGVVILDYAPVIIADHVNIAPRVQLLTVTHPIDPDARREGWEASEPITVGSGAWIGAGAMICPGVTIGEQAVIGAGSVVVKDIPPGVVAVGNPCRVVRQIGPRDHIDIAP